ncbi:MAG: hypothetical protein HGA78_09590 [Nitrospirales bacterium]|nr:hypothetical protein [Nitrospirales bacterium]
MNELVPFHFGQFQTQEAVYSADPLEWVKRYRFTRKAMGDFLYSGSKDPQKVIDKIIERNPHLKTLSIPVTVTGMTGQKYGVETYDIWGLYKISIESDAPRKKDFLKAFPDFLLALQSGKIKPLPPKARNKKVLALEGLKEIENLPYGERVEARQRFAEGVGMSLKTSYRLEKLTPEHRYTRGWAKRIIEKHLPLWLQMEQLLSQGHTQKETARLLGVSTTVVSMYKNYYSKKIGELLAYGNQY